MPCVPRSVERSSPQVRVGSAVRFHVQQTVTSIPPAKDEPRFSSYANQRAHARVKVELEIEFSSVHNFFSGFVENLSAGGVFIATYQPLSVGETIEFSIMLPGSETPVTGVGEVRWVREPQEGSDAMPGMGIRFLALQADADAAIGQYVSCRDPIFYEE